MIRVSILRMKNDVAVDMVLVEFDSPTFLPMDATYQINASLYTPQKQTIAIGGNGDVEQIIDVSEHDDAWG